MLWLTERGLDEVVHHSSLSPRGSAAREDAALMARDEWAPARSEQVRRALTLARTPRRLRRARLRARQPTILRGDCVQLQGETWQRGAQLSSRQMTRGSEGRLVFPAVVLKPGRCRPLTPGLGPRPCLFTVLSQFQAGRQSGRVQCFWSLTLCK